MSVITPPDLDLADFVPKRRLISNVTKAKQAVVTTVEDHGYEDVTFVRLHSFAPNPMVLDTVNAEILEIIDTKNFRTNVDTSAEFAFSEPTFPPPFTQSHCVPITGDVMNVADNAIA